MTANGHDHGFAIPRERKGSPDANETLELLRNVADLVLKMNRVMLLMAQQQTDLVAEIAELKAKR